MRELSIRILRGKTFRFSTHKIHDKEKHDELLKLLSELFSTEGSLKSSAV